MSACRSGSTAAHVTGALVGGECSGRDQRSSGHPSGISVYFGAGLARHLRAEGIAVSEVGRPKRQRRARFGKSDDADAAGAAAMVLAGDALGEPKSADGAAEMVRVLRVARTSVVRARAKAYNALQDLVVTAPAALREQLAGLYKDRLIYACERFPEPETLTTPTDAVTVAIKSLAARCRELDTEAARLARHVDTITATAAPELRAICGVGPDTAATLLTALGDNPNRIGSDAAFAKLCGVSPLEASSGKTIRHRLNREGNRDANRALRVILVVRMRRHGPTRDYFARRLADGKTKNEIMRCIKRYIAREIYHAVREPSRRTNELIA